MSCVGKNRKVNNLGAGDDYSGFESRVSLLCAIANKKLSATASIMQKGMSAKAFFEYQFQYNFSRGCFTDNQVIIKLVCYIKESLGWFVMT